MELNILFWSVISRVFSAESFDKLIKNISCMTNLTLQGVNKSLINIIEDTRQTQAPK